MRITLPGRVSRAEFPWSGADKEQEDQARQDFQHSVQLELQQRVTDNDEPE
jgi:hypothetical protein